jgi:RsiW-degrading membrane proteinase PrsW (M82 family)
LTHDTPGRKIFWRTEIADIALLILFVATAQIAAPLVSGNLPQGAQLVLGLALAIVPAVLWLSIFYAQDRSQPEPRHFVIGVAILAGLLAAAVGQPLINGFFRVTNWIHHNARSEVLGSVLVIGLIQELCKFAAVRFSVYYSQEFDQRTDGVLYGTAAGVGYAAALNLDDVFAAGGFEDIGAGAIRIAVNTLMHASVGGLIGYFLARDHFDRKPVWWMPLGLVLGALTNGLFSVLRGVLSQSRLSIDASGIGSAGYSPLTALIISAAAAIAIFALVFALMRRADRAAHAQSDARGHDTVAAGATFAVAALALAGGLFARNLAESAVNTYQDASGVAISYPERWRIDKRALADGVLTMREPDTDGFPATFELRWTPVEATLDDKAAIGNAAGAIALSRAADKSAYKTYDLIMTHGQPAATSAFVYVANRGGALDTSVPVVVLGEDRLIRKGGRVYVFSMQATEADIAQVRTAFERFVNSAALP